MYTLHTHLKTHHHASYVQALHSHAHLNDSKVVPTSLSKGHINIQTHTHTLRHTQGYRYVYSKTHRQPHLQKRTHCGKMEKKNF